MGAFVAVLLLTNRVSNAHQQSATFGNVARERAPGEFIWRLRIRTSDLAAALALPAHPAAELNESAPRERAATYLRDGLHVTVGGQPCVPNGSSLAPDPGSAEPTWNFTQRFRCPDLDAAIGLRYDLFFEQDPFHESFTRLDLDDVSAGMTRAVSPSSVVFREGLRSTAFGPGEERPVWRSTAVYFRLGIFHILTGYDHLSFLMALLLGSALWRRTTAQSVATAASAKQALRGSVTLISAFTGAHSLTLIAQVLWPGWVSIRWVEPAIAFSVAYVGFENLIPRPPRHRWLVVFGFGLVHGLGFASVLRQIGLPRRGLVLCLLSFNLGVETGQLLVLAVAFPLIVAAARRAPRRFERWGVQLGSGVIALFGTAWLVARLAAQ